MHSVSSSGHESTKHNQKKPWDPDYTWLLLGMLIVREVILLGGDNLTLLTQGEAIVHPNERGNGNISSANERIIMAIGYLM